MTLHLLDPLLKRSLRYALLASVMSAFAWLAPSVYAVKLVDINRDGIVDARDADNLAEVLVGVIDAPTTDPLDLDVNEDSRWDVADVVATTLLAQRPDEFKGVSAVAGVQIGTNRVDFSFTEGEAARVELIDESVLRVRFSRSGTYDERITGAIAPTGLSIAGSAISDAGDIVLIDSSKMKVRVQKSPFRIDVFNPDGTLLMADREPSIVWNEKTNLILAQKLAPQDEHYFGLGMRGGPPNRRGRVIVMRNQDFGLYGEFSDQLYQSIPFYYGVRQGRTYGVFFDNSAEPFFDLDSGGHNELRFGAQRGDLNYYVIAGPQPSDVLHAYDQLTGFQALPPKWVLGYQHSRYGWSSAQEIEDIAKGFRDGAYPCDVLYLDLDYQANSRNHFSWNPETFPDPVGFNANLETKGFKRVNILDAAIVVEDPLYQQMLDQKLFLRDFADRTLVNEIFLGTLSWIDFSNPATRAWYRPRLKTFLETGVSGVWNDLNEPAKNQMPEAFYDFDGDPRADVEGRNLFALQETSNTQTTLLELRPDKRPYVLSRAAYSGSQRFTSTWSGDTLTSFDSLRVSIQTTVNMGLSGQNLFGHDTGGFFGTPSAELYVRWLSFTGYISLFRTHCVDFVEKREPWLWGEPYSSQIRSILEERYRFIPYLYTLFEQAERTSQPPVAPTMFYFPGDIATHGQDTAFMLGSELLIAPIYESATTTRTLYLPGGVNWVNFDTDQVYTGGQTVTVQAPLGKVGRYATAGSIIPLGPVRQYTSDSSAGDDLSAEVFFGPPREFVLYEDEGDGFAYRSGQLLYTSLNTSGTTQLKRRLAIKRLAGSYLPPARAWTIKFHAVGSLPASVTINGSALQPVASEADLADAASGWFFDDLRYRLLAKFPDSSDEQQVEVIL